LISSALASFAVFVLVKTIDHAAYWRGYKKGYMDASYDAAKIQTDIKFQR
jgi:hypothetical protein